MIGDEGFQQGFQEGLQEYRQEESLRLVNRLLRHKFGINAELRQTEQRLQTLSVEQLEELAEALLDFTRIDDLNNWLAR